MSSNEFTHFLEDMHKLHTDPIFVEFLQQLFPWVSSTVVDPSSPGTEFRQIRWATEEIGKVLFAVHSDSEGFVRLVRGTSDRPRSSWSQLLRGQNTTTRLNAKLIYFILEVFHFARPTRQITSWYKSNDSSHRHGIFNGTWVLQHRDSDGAIDTDATGAAVCPPVFDETWVFLHVESPDGQDHICVTERDVLVEIRVGTVASHAEPGGGSNLSGIVTVASALTRQNAMSFCSDNDVKSDSASSIASSSTLLEQNLDSYEAETDEEEVSKLYSSSSISEKLSSSDVNSKMDKVQAQQQTKPAGNLPEACPVQRIQLVNSLFLHLSDETNQLLSIKNAKVKMTLDCGSDTCGVGPSSKTKEQVIFPPAS